MDTVDREVDLYHDLEDPFFPVEKEDSPVQPTPSPHPPISTEEMDQLKDQNTKLSLQNKALKKNISCLFKTARLEIDRKEIAIKGLEERVTDLECILQFSINIGSSIFGSESVEESKQLSSVTGNGCLGTQGVSDNGFTTVAGPREVCPPELSEASVVEDVDVKQDSSGCSTPQTDRQQLKHARASVKEKPHHSQHVEDNGRQSSQPLESDSDVHKRLIDRHCKTGEPDKFDLRHKLQSGRSSNVDSLCGGKTSKIRQSDRDEAHHRPASKHHHSRYSSSPPRRHKPIDDSVRIRGVERSPLRSRRRSSRTREGHKRRRRQSLSPRERERSWGHLPHPCSSARDEKYHHRPRHSPRSLHETSEYDSPIALRSSNDVDDDTFSTVSHCTLGSLDDACVRLCDFDESYVSDAPHDDTDSLEDGEIRDDLSDTASCADEDELSSSCTGAGDRSVSHSPSHAHKVVLSPSDTIASSAGVGAINIPHSNTIKLLDHESPCDDSKSPQDTALDSHIESEMDRSPGIPRHTAQGSHVDSEVDSAPQHIAQRSHVDSEVDRSQHTALGSHVGSEVDSAPQHTTQGSHVDSEMDSAPQHTAQGSHVDSEVDRSPGTPQHTALGSHVDSEADRLPGTPQHTALGYHVDSEADRLPGTPRTALGYHVDSEVDRSPGIPQHTAQGSHVDSEVDSVHASHADSDMDKSQHTLLGSSIDSEMVWNQSPPSLGSRDPPQPDLEVKPHSDDKTPHLTALGSHINSEMDIISPGTPQFTAMNQAELHWYPATPDLGSRWNKPDPPQPEVNPQWFAGTPEVRSHWDKPDPGMEPHWGGGSPGTPEVRSHWDKPDPGMEPHWGGGSPGTPEVRSHWDKPDPGMEPHWGGGSPGTPDLAALGSHWDRPPEMDPHVQQGVKSPGTPELAALCDISLEPVHNDRSSRFMPFDFHCSDSLLDALGSISSKELGCSFPAAGAITSDLLHCSPDHSSCGTLSHSRDLTLQPNTPVTTTDFASAFKTISHETHTPSSPVSGITGAFEPSTPTVDILELKSVSIPTADIYLPELHTPKSVSIPTADIYLPELHTPKSASTSTADIPELHTPKSVNIADIPELYTSKSVAGKPITPTDVFKPSTPEPAELSTGVSTPATPSTPGGAAPGGLVRDHSVDVMSSSEVEVVELMVGGGEEGGKDGREQLEEGGEDGEEFEEETQDIETERDDELEEGEVTDSSEEGDTLPAEDSSVVYLDDLTNLIDTEGWENELEAITRVNRMKKPIPASQTRKHSCDGSSDSNDGRADERCVSARSRHSYDDQNTHRSRNDSTHSVSTRSHSRHSHDKMAVQSVHSRLGVRVRGHEQVRERCGPEMLTRRHAHGDERPSRHCDRSRSPHHCHHSTAAQSARLHHHLERRLRTKH